MKKQSRRKFIQKLGLGLSTSARWTKWPLSSLELVGHPERKLTIASCGLGQYSIILKDNIRQLQYCRLEGIITGTPAKAQHWKNESELADKKFLFLPNLQSNQA